MRHIREEEMLQSSGASH